MNSILIPLIRRVMPGIIANDIISVSPMIGPASQIFTLKVRYQLMKDRRVKVKKEIYRTFLRINNRRKTQSDNDFSKAGYWQGSGAFIDVIGWCTEQFGAHGYWHNHETGTVWFATETDYTAYCMVWQ
jgi:Major capsid protein Gp23